MSEFNKQYYFVRAASKDGIPELTPDENTKDRKFSNKKQDVGSAPLIFSNGLAEYQKKQKIPQLKTLPEILFSGADMIVSSRIRNALIEMEIPYLHLHPAIYIDDQKKWNEDYWYMTFTEYFDCWDRDASTYSAKPMEVGGETLYNMFSYSLNDELLEKTPLAERLLFKMGGTLTGYVICHESIAKLFSTFGDGAKFTSIDEY